MTDATTHTPGPWRVDSFSKSYFIEAGGCAVAEAMDRPRRVVTIISGEEIQTETRQGPLGEETVTRRKVQPFAYGDAHLIAAAPDLLDVARRVLNLTLDAEDDAHAALIRDAQAAIAKAEGR